MLKIDHHRMSSIPVNAFAESDMAGRITRFHLINGNLSALPVGTLQPLRKLKTLDLHGNKLKVLQRGQFKGLRDTEVLDLSWNELAKVDASHLGDLTKLGWLNISHNQLSELTR